MVKVLKSSNILQFGGTGKGNLATVGICQVHLISADCKVTIYLKRGATHNSVIIIKVLSTSNMRDFQSSPRVLHFRFGGELEQ